jgi:hypothetical protein
MPPELTRVLTDYEAAWQRKDARALAALFTEDGFVLASGVPPVRGRDAIEKHYTGQGGPLSLRALAFSTEGSTGYIIGGFAPGRGENDVGKFTLTLRRGRVEVAAFQLVTSILAAVAGAAPYREAPAPPA